MSDDTVQPETAGDLMEYELLINDEWLSIVTEMNAKDIEMNCPSCGELHDESILYLFDGGQYLYKGLCCGMFGVLVANGEDNGLETE